MDADELSETLNDLEQRVERLRALYEQYFMGIEKIEPTVPRKEVERRFWTLRRAQIRNTAMRFKLNTINQRYNTYQQYWQRCLREIEAGTYRRHVAKAEKRFGAEALTIAARKRLTKKQQEDVEKKREAEEKAQRALEQMPDIDVFDVEVDVDMSDVEGDELFAPARSPARAPQPAARRKQAHALDELDDLESLMGLDAGPTVRAASSYPAAIPAPQQPRRVAPPAAPPPAAARRPSNDFGDIGGVFSEDDDDQTAPHQRLPSPPRVPPPPPRVPPAPRTSQSAPRPPQPTAPAPPPAHSTRPARPPAPARPLPPQRPSAPLPPRAPSPPQRAAAAPTGPKPPAAARPAPAARSASPTRQDLSDDRVKEIYREYVNAKRKCNESTSSVTEANLARSLRSSAEKLSKKHKGKRVDYEVVIKNGHAVLKPVVKG